MESIDQLSNTVIWLIRVGAMFRVTYCAFRLVTADEDAGRFKNRAKQTLLFYVIAEVAWVLKALAIGYYG